MLYILTDWRKRLQTATFNIGLYRKPHVNAGQTKERTDRQTDMRISTMKPECATVFRWRRKNKLPIIIIGIPIMNTSQLIYLVCTTDCKLILYTMYTFVHIYRLKLQYETNYII